MNTNTGHMKPFEDLTEKEKKDPNWVRVGDWMKNFNRGQRKQIGALMKKGMAEKEAVKSIVPNAKYVD